MINNLSIGQRLSRGKPVKFNYFLIAWISNYPKVFCQVQKITEKYNLRDVFIPGRLLP